MRNIEHIRHSLAHLLAGAVQKKYPKVKLGIGPTIENGFYYDFFLPKGVTLGEQDFSWIQEEMRKMISSALPFSGKKTTSPAAKKIFKDQPFKVELIDEFRKAKKPITIYYTGGSRIKDQGSIVFMDLCKGGHVKNTREIPADAFRLTKVAGAYWRGDEKNKMLTRVYGVAFETKKELDEYLKMLEEAEKRDHKKLGRELDLFVFSDLVGPGLPLFTPKGTLLRVLLDNFVWQLREKRGYARVEIPHITKKELYETSGHWEKFKDELFRIKTREGHEFAMKPMNCPHHTQIYARRAWSYRELPQRYASTTMCYRDEQTGELSGLSRVRAFAQDDAHVFCRFSQAKDEFLKIWDIVHEFYGAFGFNLRVRRSTHDPKHQEKYLGDKKKWRVAEDMLLEILREKQAEYFDGIGEAAFYGPKLDFMARDSLGREWQVATIQLDMNMPERFELSCADETGKPERIVMIHAAIMGSIERFLSILIEHYAGAFPLWLSPLQVAVLPVGERFSGYALDVLKELRAIGARAEVFGDDSLGKRIREAELQKIPYVLIVGEKEEAAKSVSVRRRGAGDLGAKELSLFLNELRREIQQKA